MLADKNYDPKHSEQSAQTRWAENKTYAFDESSSQKVYSVDTPPPTVSGSLHIGHVFSYTHADIIARYKRMRGYNVFYPMGFDDNGLATERFVEKKNGVKAYLMKRSEFINLCLKETLESEKQFEKLWRHLGLSIDWSRTYSTISPVAQKVAQYSFSQLYKKNLAYRKQEPHLYCTTCRTSVAQAELDSADVNSSFNDLIFKTERGEELVIATTRPELLPGCVAVFFHPDDTRYNHLAGSFAITPIFEKPVKLIPDDKVDPAKGTGLVMCCTFGDQTDIYWQKKHDLPYIQVVGFDGKWTSHTGPLEGLGVHDARKKILELLASNQALKSQKPIVHAVSTHERCKQEIEYLVLNQWFVKIIDHKEKFLELGEQINWKPSFMKARYRDWVSNLNWDWCISRQRFYGIPFPVWHCLDCNNTILADDSMLPVDPQETSYPGGGCPSCHSHNLQPETDVMDTWFTSGSTPSINMRWPNQGPENLTLPMSMRPQAHDIIRTWAFYTIIKTYYHFGTLPWHDLMISGHVLAGKEKISKSQGNSKMAPEALLEAHQADVVRYWTANGRPGTDTAFSENQFKIGNKLVTKLWNAYKFMHEHMQKPEGSVEISDTLCKWIMHQHNTMIEDYCTQLDAYEYTSALESLESFFWKDLCDNYLELIKDRLFNPDNHDAGVIAQTRTTLYTIAQSLLKLFAPYIPYITEELYQLVFKADEKAESVHTTMINPEAFTARYPETGAIINDVLAVVNAVRKVKSEQQVSLKTEVSHLTVVCPEDARRGIIDAHKQIICGICKIQAFETKASGDANCLRDESRFEITVVLES